MAEQIEKLDFRLLVDTAVLAGEIMLMAGGETYRVEDTIRRILKTSGFERCDVFAVTTGIMVTLADYREETISITRRIGDKNTNLGDIYEVNEISRRYCNDEISLKQAFHSLKNLNQEFYSLKVIYFSMILATAGFTLLLGGGITECLIAAVNGVFLLLTWVIKKRLNINTFVMNMITSFSIAFTSMAVKNLIFPDINLEILVAGSNMALLPGVAITNAIRDTLQGDFASGGARAIEAFVIALSIGVGIGTGLAFCGSLLGGDLW